MTDQYAAQKSYPTLRYAVDDDRNNVNVFSDKRRQETDIGVFSIAVLFLCGVCNPLLAGNAAIPLEVIEEVPTLKCLGVRWLIGADDNANATISLRYRVTGIAQWQRGMDLFRVETQGIRQDQRPSKDKTLYAGSIFYLNQNTTYDVELSLHDPDGGSAKKLLHMKTWREPQLPRRFKEHVHIAAITKHLAHSFQEIKRFGNRLKHVHAADKIAR